jgi:hypothetical protein
VSEKIGITSFAYEAKNVFPMKIEYICLAGGGGPMRTVALRYTDLSKDVLDRLDSICQELIEYANTLDNVNSAIEKVE